MKTANQRRPLFKWIAWFFLILSATLFLIQLAFLNYLPKLSEVYGATTTLKMTSYVFLFTSFVTQACLFAFAAALITLLLTTLFPQKWLMFAIAILLASALVIFQSIDLIVYSMYHSHEIVVGIKVITMNALDHVIPLSIEEVLFLILIIAVIFLIEMGIGWWLWRFTQKRQARESSIWIATFIIACFIFSYGLTASVISVPKNYQLNETLSLMLLKAARTVPYYSETYEFIMPVQDRYQRTIETDNGPLSYQTEQPIFPMLYPKKPLHCDINESLPNILFIIIDSWRFDKLNQAITPNIYHFAQKTLQFNDHWSGGNCTKTGMFSLFYGIPENYWDAVKDDKLGPVLIKLLQHHYQFGIYASATLTFPAFNKTIFQDIKHIRLTMPGKTTADRDKKITKEFERFLTTRKLGKPFFGVLFYDSAHNYCGGGPRAYQTPFQPAVRSCARFSLGKHSDATPYINRYDNALYFIDQQIGKALADLQAHGLEENTIIIITSDHGEQFNDEKLGYWGHNSIFSSYQLHVPLLIYWPGKQPEVIDHFTSHYDVVPTLLKNAFACTTPIKNYSTGQSLFKADHRDFLISANYTSYAVLTRERDTTFYPNGAYDIRTLTGQPIPFARLNAKIIRQANQDLVWFFR